MKTKRTIESARAIARSRGGDCLSSEYNGPKHKLEWKCKNNHTWTALYSNIARGVWCPECNIGFAEKCCRYFLETIFKQQFVKSRPKWLINKRGNQMELDGFCELLSVAFEHNGLHHYKSTPFLTKEKLAQRKQDDATKVELCRQNNVKLIIVPALGQIIKIENLKTFIKQQCEELQIIIPNDFDSIAINVNNVYAYNDREAMNNKYLKELKELAISKNGLLLSDKYVNNNYKLKWFCNICRKSWLATPRSVKSGYWCHNCGKYRPKKS